jgi:hypothetical protein
MSDNDVYCMKGIAAHSNDDVMGDDQEIYSDGRLLVYINHRTGRVTDVQRSY